jgi:hypothetical protein
MTSSFLLTSAVENRCGASKLLPMPDDANVEPDYPEILEFRRHLVGISNATLALSENDWNNAIVTFRFS